MNKLQTLMDDIRQWSDAAFGYGQRNPAIVYHLQKEVGELIDAMETNPPAIMGEFADCFMLLLDSANHHGISANELVDLTYHKLAINKKRKWGKPDKNGVVEHIRGEATE